MSSLMLTKSVEVVLQMLHRALEASKVLHHVVHVTLYMLESIVKLVEINNWGHMNINSCIVDNIYLIWQWSS